MLTEKEKKMLADAFKLTGGDPKKITSAIRKVIPPSLCREGKAYLWRILRPALEKKLCNKKKNQPASAQVHQIGSNSELVKTKITLTEALKHDAWKHEVFHHSRQN